MNYYQLIFKNDYRDMEFYEEQTYIFKSELELKKGDYVVTMTRFGYSIAVVFEKNNIQTLDLYSLGIAKIVCKLDGNYYEEKERREKLKELRRQLKYKAENLSEVLKFETLAKYDNEAKEMLDEYKKLSNSSIYLPNINTEIKEDNLPF